MERDINGGRHQDEREDRSTNKARKPNVSGSRWLDESRQKRKERLKPCCNIQILGDVSGAQAPNLTKVTVCSTGLNTRDSYLCINIGCISLWCQISTELYNICRTNTSSLFQQTPTWVVKWPFSDATCISRWRNTPLPLNDSRWPCAESPLRCSHRTDRFQF